MKQHYFIGFLLVCFLLLSNTLTAQNTITPAFSPEKPIVGLSIYPNPVTGTKVYITSYNNASKEVEVFNVLGKQVLSSFMTGKELDVSELTPGIYILKIKEGTNQATRKLIVR